jgi:hypothetical protein
VLTAYPESSAWEFVWVEIGPRPDLEIIDILINPVHDGIIAVVFPADPDMLGMLWIQADLASPPAVVKEIDLIDTPIEAITHRSQGAEKLRRFKAKLFLELP